MANPKSKQSDHSPRIGTRTASIDRFAHVFERFMKPYLVLLNPIMHSTVWRDRRFTENQIIVVLGVSRIGPVSPSEISKAFSLQKGSLSSVIQNMCEIGLIQQIPSPGDERSYRLVITPDGTAFVRHMDQQRLAGFRQLFASMPDETCLEVIRVFETLNNYLDTGRDDNDVVEERQGS